MAITFKGANTEHFSIDTKIPKWCCKRNIRSALNRTSLHTQWSLRWILSPIVYLCVTVVFVNEKYFRACIYILMTKFYCDDQSVSNFFSVWARFLLLIDMKNWIISQKKHLKNDRYERKKRLETIEKYDEIYEFVYTTNWEYVKKSIVIWLVGMYTWNAHESSTLSPTKRVFNCVYLLL